MIYIGNSDGKIHVWDLTDQSHKEVQEINVSSDGITCMKFHKKQNILVRLSIWTPSDRYPSPSEI